MRAFANSEIETPPGMVCPIPSALEGVARPGERPSAYRECLSNFSKELAFTFCLALVYYYSFG